MTAHSSPRGIEVDLSQVQFYRSIPGRPFKVEVTKRDGSVIATTMNFADSAAAAQYGMDLGNDPFARIEVQPVGSVNHG